MTKIYLVCAQGCEKKGKIDISSKKFVKFVYTNYKLARNCAEYLNEAWRMEFFKVESNFEHIEYHYVETRTISKIDFTKLPY